MGVFQSFLDFKFNNKYAHEFGITRVITGDRYEENFISQKKELTSNVPGADGQLYWGSTTAKKEIKIDYAF